MLVLANSLVTRQLVLGGERVKLFLSLLSSGGTLQAQLDPSGDFQFT